MKLVRRVCNDLACCGREAVCVGECPEISVRIKEELHLAGGSGKMTEFSKRSSISLFVSGESQSSASHICPLAAFKRLLLGATGVFVADGTGTSFSAGLPGLSISTSSPLSAAEMSCERWVSAYWALTFIRLKVAERGGWVNEWFTLPPFASARKMGHPDHLWLF